MVEQPDLDKARHGVRPAKTESGAPTHSISKETVMKNLKMAFVLIAATLAAGAASAQVQFNVPGSLPIAQSTLTRAEVTADLLIWRASGLYALHNQGEQAVDTTTRDYAQAMAKYSYMRASPQFAALVDQINRGVSTRALVASR
jgi:hypothetical protein